jgi:flavorubredoxin
MSSPFKAVKISDSAYWVGAIDWSIRDFHGYLTGRGSTYNAYLIVGEKVTLVDTVKRQFKDEFLSRVSSVVDLCDIDYIVSNHAEMDHSGCLPEAIDLIEPEKVFCSAMGAKALAKHFHWDHELVAVKDGETVRLGDKTLKFIETRMVHWPDSMFSYLVEDKVLFSQDGFGMHLASSERFADEIDEDTLEWEAEKYFANILLLYAPIIKKLLKKVGDMGIEIDTIAPDHGPVWRRPQDISKVIGWYGEWSDQKPRNGAVIVYDTMWNSTETMARAIEEGLTEGGASTKLMRASACHRSNFPVELLNAGALLLGSPTINNGLFPAMSDILTYLRGLKPRNLIGAAFGSYGWTGEAVKLLETELETMQVEIVADSIRVQYVPDDDVLNQCRALGRKVAEELQKRCGN